VVEQVLNPSAPDPGKTLIFVETKRNCDNVTRMLRMDGWPALAIHGDKNQQERDWVLQVLCARVCSHAYDHNHA
jgi:superfamily II DNA/RNA helicase